MRYDGSPAVGGGSGGYFPTGEEELRSPARGAGGRASCAPPYTGFAAGYSGYGATPGGYAHMAESRTRATGVLKVFVRTATGLKPADWNGKADPYVWVKSGGQKAKTKIVKKTLDPAWNELVSFSGRLSDFLQTGLHLQVFDWDSMLKMVYGSTDDDLGGVTVALDCLHHDDGPHDFAERLPTQGSIRFSVTWEPSRAAGGAGAGGGAGYGERVSFAPPPRPSPASQLRQCAVGLDGASASNWEVTPEVAPGSLGSVLPRQCAVRPPTSAGRSPYRDAGPVELF